MPQQRINPLTAAEQSAQRSGYADAASGRQNQLLPCIDPSLLRHYLRGWWAWTPPYLSVASVREMTPPPGREEAYGAEQASRSTGLGTGRQGAA